jgi:hypothetical protein
MTAGACPRRQTQCAGLPSPPPLKSVMRPAGRPPRNTSSSPTMPVGTFLIAFLRSCCPAGSLCFTFRVRVATAGLLYSMTHAQTITVARVEDYAFDALPYPSKQHLTDADQRTAPGNLAADNLRAVARFQLARVAFVTIRKVVKTGHHSIDCEVIINFQIDVRGPC